MTEGLKKRGPADKAANITEDSDEPAEYPSKEAMRARPYTCAQRWARKVLGYSWLVIFFLTVLLSWIFSWLLFWTVWVCPTRWPVRRTAVFFVGICGSYLNLMWSFRRLGKQTNPVLPEKCILCCNHQSFADAFVIQRCLGLDHVFLIMEAVKHMPIFGSLLGACGCVFVGFKESGETEDGFKCTSREQSLTEAKEAVCNGVRVLIFPEGWLSRDGKLRKFKNGAFEAAIETGASILPIALAGGQMVWPPDEMPSFGTQYLMVGEPISTDGMTMKDMDVLKATTKGAILELRKDIFKELDNKL